MEIKRIIGKQFKGKPDFDYTFGHVTELKGQNGSGKTTVGATAPLWVFTGYSADLKSNPKVDNINSAESEPSITVVCEHDGKTFSITKTQHIKTVQDGDTVKKSTNNTFMFNEVPITERDLKKKLLEMGIDPDKLLFLMHTGVVTSWKAQDIKKILFEMSSEKSPLEVSKMMPDTLELSRELEQGYSLDEIIAKYKASKKKSDEAIKAIPEQIIGLERAKSSEDPTPLLDKKNELEMTIHSLQDKMASEDKTDEIAEVRSQLFAVKREISECERKESEKESHYKREQAEHVLEIKRKINDIQTVRYKYKRDLDDVEFELARKTKEKAEIISRYRELKREKPPVFEPPKKLTDADMICPCCGQALPEELKAEKIAGYEKAYKQAEMAHKAAVKAWERTNGNAIEEATAKGQTVCDRIRELEKQMEKISTSMGNANEDLERHKGFLEKAQEEEVQPYVHEAAYVQEMDKLRERESYLEQLLKASAEIASNRASIEAQIAILRSQAVDIDRKLAVVANNETITDKIAELQTSRMEYEQAKADAEKMLYQVDVLSRRMNDLFVEEINSHFSLVKWQLFEYQKNGGYKEICVPTIDGYRFGESTNTGREIRGKLDICQSLQKFYGMTVPIILDNAESINDFNLPKLDSQLILLTVTDDKELVVEHD